MIVELLKARRHQQLPQLLQIPVPQIRLLSVENIHIGRTPGLQIRPQPLQRRAAFFVVLAAIYVPPFTVTRMFPCRSVRYTAAPFRDSLSIASWVG